MAKHRNNIHMTRFRLKAIQGHRNTFKIKTASSDEWALAVRARLDMLPSMHAAIGLTHTTPSVSVFPMICGLFLLSV